jgi:hypothetical protein
MAVGAVDRAEARKCARGHLDMYLPSAPAAANGTQAAGGGKGGGGSKARKSLPKTQELDEMEVGD